MKPRPSCPRRDPSTAQLSLLLEPSRLVALDDAGRTGVIAVLARLLGEAAAPAREQEAGDDAS